MKHLSINLPVWIHIALNRQNRTGIVRTSGSRPHWHCIFLLDSNLSQLHIPDLSQDPASLFWIQLEEKRLRLVLPHLLSYGSGQQLIGQLRVQATVNRDRDENSSEEGKYGLPWRKERWSRRREGLRESGGGGSSRWRRGEGRVAIGEGEGGDGLALGGVIGRGERDDDDSMELGIRFHGEFAGDE